MKDKGEDVKVEWFLINADEINFEIQPTGQEVSQEVLFVVMVEKVGLHPFGAKPGIML